MRIFTSKRALAIVCSLFLGSLLFQSCGGDVSTLSNKEIAELQSQLDSTMQLYQQVKQQNAEFDKQMASRDSAINAQAEEIQNLINQMDGKKGTARIDKTPASDQQKELREKESTIRQLQKQLDQQTKQLNALKANTGNSTAKDNSAEYKTRYPSCKSRLPIRKNRLAI